MSRRKDNYETSRWLKFKKWVDGEIDPLADGMEIRVPEAEAENLGKPEAEAAVDVPANPATAGTETVKTMPTPARPRSAFAEDRGIRIFRRFYQVMSVLLCFSIIFVLLWTIAYLPVFGAGILVFQNKPVQQRFIRRKRKQWLSDQKDYERWRLKRQEKSLSPLRRRSLC